MLPRCNIFISIVIWVMGGMLVACASPQTLPAPTLTEVASPLAADRPVANLPNPASVYCEQQGHTLEIRTAADGRQSGVCIFADGSECDEWAYFRGECGPVPAPTSEAMDATLAPTEIPTALPIDPADYQGWWTYTHAVYNFSIMLSEEWVVEETTVFNPLMNGHTLILHPNYSDKEIIRMTFRRAGEDVPLWPTGVGQGQFIQQGTLDIAGQPALRRLLVCPNGDVTSIWYHQAEGQPNITRGDMEFGFIYSIGGHCEAGYSLSGKVQRVGEMIMASLKMP